MEVRTNIITHSKDLPELCKGSFFHSNNLFCMLEQTPRLRPCMVVAIDEKGGVVGQILAQIRVSGVSCTLISLVEPASMAKVVIKTILII